MQNVQVIYIYIYIRLPLKWTLYEENLKLAYKWLRNMSWTFTCSEGIYDFKVFIKWETNYKKWLKT